MRRQPQRPRSDDRPGSPAVSQCHKNVAQTPDLSIPDTVLFVTSDRPAACPALGIDAATFAEGPYSPDTVLFVNRSASPEALVRHSMPPMLHLRCPTRCCSSASASPCPVANALPRPVLAVFDHRTTCCLRNSAKCSPCPLRVCQRHASRGWRCHRQPPPASYRETTCSSAASLQMT